MPLALGVLLACHRDRPRAATALGPPVAASPSSAPDPDPPVPADAGTAAANDLATDPPPPRRRSFANLDPSDDLVVGPPDALVACDADLKDAEVTYRPATLPVQHDPKGKLTCGAPQVVVYIRGPGAISYDPPPLLTCPMALALASYERILQEEALRAFGAPVVRIQQLGTYSCRGIVRFKGVVSEHSYANAIDLATFKLGDGRTISVQHDFDRGASLPASAASAFLRGISQRGQDEDVFSNVLTPFWDAAHKDHFHLDLARYRVNGARP